MHDTTMSREDVLEMIPSIANHLGNETYLVTGGTGFIGRALIRKILETRNPRRAISYSRRWDASESLVGEIDDNRLRIINGDICSYDDIRSAMKGVDYVIHAAAYKSVPSAEYNPFEATRVNVHGSESVIRAAIDAGVKRCLMISSDKACAPVNLYGKTKAVMESMSVSANNLGDTRFAVARYGNVVGSTGSVFPFFAKKIREDRRIPITDLTMTRFWFEYNDAVSFVLHCLDTMTGGEVFVPNLKSSSIKTLAEAFLNVDIDASVDILGPRPGEKKHEFMISADESRRVVTNGSIYVIKPEYHHWDSNKWVSWRNWAVPNMPDGLSSEDSVVDVDEMKKIVRRYYEDWE